MKCKCVEEIEKNYSLIVRYDMIGANKAGYTGHPQRVMRELGFDWDGAIPESIGDCWFFRVKEMADEKPFIEVSSHWLLSKKTGV